MVVAAGCGPRFWGSSGSLPPLPVSARLRPDVQACGGRVLHERGPHRTVGGLASIIVDGALVCRPGSPSWLPSAVLIALGGSPLPPRPWPRLGTLSSQGSHTTGGPVFVMHWLARGPLLVAWILWLWMTVCIALGFSVTGDRPIVCSSSAYRTMQSLAACLVGTTSAFAVAGRLPAGPGVAPERGSEAVEVSSSSGRPLLPIRIIEDSADSRTVSREHRMRSGQSPRQPHPHDRPRCSSGQRTLRKGSRPTRRPASREAQPTQSAQPRGEPTRPPPMEVSHGPQKFNRANPPPGPARRCSES